MDLVVYLMIKISRFRPFYERHPSIYSLLAQKKMQRAWDIQGGGYENYGFIVDLTFYVAHYFQWSIFFFIHLVTIKKVRSQDEKVGSFLEKNGLLLKKGSLLKRWSTWHFRPKINQFSKFYKLVTMEGLGNHLSHFFSISCTFRINKKTHILPVYLCCNYHYIILFVSLQRKQA